MPTHKLTDIDIAVHVVPTRLRWPEACSSTTWTKAHHCVNALHEFVRGVDRNCSEAEQNISVAIVRRRRAEICDQALGKLTNFAAFDIAEKALSDNIGALERLSDRDPAQAQMLEKLTRALGDLREGIAATRRMILTRCKLGERVSV